MRPHDARDLRPAFRRDNDADANGGDDEERRLTSRPAPSAARSTAAWSRTRTRSRTSLARAPHRDRGAGAHAAQPRASDHASPGLGELQADGGLRLGLAEEDRPARSSKSSSTLRFIAEGANVVLVGPNGVGKTMIAQEPRLPRAPCRTPGARAKRERPARRPGARQESSVAARATPPTLRAARDPLHRRGRLPLLRHRHADLLFEVVTRRYEKNRSIVLTTNKPFAEWNEVFESSTCRHPRRPARPPGRDRRHRGRLLPPQGGQGTEQQQTPSDVPPRARPARRPKAKRASR